jgi:hypothetical protein
LQIYFSNGKIVYVATRRINSERHQFASGNAFELLPKLTERPPFAANPVAEAASVVASFQMVSGAGVERFSVSGDANMWSEF